MAKERRKSIRRKISAENFLGRCKSNKRIKTRNREHAKKEKIRFLSSREMQPCLNGHLTGSWLDSVNLENRGKICGKSRDNRFISTVVGTVSSQTLCILQYYHFFVLFLRTDEIILFLFFRNNNFEQNSILWEKRIILNLQEHVKQSDRDEKEKKGAKRKRGFFKHGTIS